ncbi:FAD-binding protein [Mangrovicoccus ximenensis]|uniref:FAD-binding protein n=1 Tax=Mangrovicoccus ximenensis TaxID=1911570 RepID=UPI000D3A2B24|nr:FAD-binding protein [Mangrovicoccus ximenensis]
MDSLQIDIPERLRAAAVTPESPGYDEARALYNGMIDKRPRFILRCRDPEDVRAAIGFARAAQLPLAIRGGGHNACRIRKAGRDRPPPPSRAGLPPLRYRAIPRRALEPQPGSAKHGDGPEARRRRGGPGRSEDAPWARSR